MSEHQRVSLDTLVAKWAKVAAEVERGYTLTIDDYLNDVDLRHRIASRLRTASANTQVAESLALADERFRAATIVTDICVWGRANAIDEAWNPEREWYYFRLPKQRLEDW